jgi:hypothetical protein
MPGAGSATTRTSAGRARRGTTGAATMTRAAQLRAAGWVELPLRPLGWTPWMSETGALFFECGQCGLKSVHAPNGPCKHGVKLPHGAGAGVWW